MRAQLLTGTALLLAVASVLPASAEPTGASAGSNVTIVQDGKTTTIHQTTQNAIIDWKSFDVGRDETVHFDQPGRDSATLNRVEAGHESTIAGTITAPGTVIIYNSNGVVFTDSAHVDVGSLVATSIPISETDFNAGRLHFEGSAAPGAIVSNAGAITVADTGLAALVGTRVANSGTITARLGTVALAAGDMVTLDLAGDGLFNIAVGKVSSATGGTLVDQSGTIVADGGRVVLSAAAAAGVVDSAINLSGVVRAHGIEAGAGGSVVLSGTGGAVRVSGAIDVASAASTGGTAVVTGDTVALAPTARIDATGATGGGEVRVGGGFQGRDPAIANARETEIAAGAVIDASATVAGAGGGVVVWADDRAAVGGTIVARGAGTGDGGFVETSGKGTLAVGIGATVDTGAAGGRAGTWLLDPTSITIQAGGSAGSVGAANGAAGASTIDPSVIVAALGTGNVLLVADDLITVDADIVATNAQLNGHALGLVTATAGSSIQVNKSIILDDRTGHGGLVLQSQGDIRLGRDAVLFADAGTIWLESVGAAGDIVQDTSAGYTGAVIADAVVARGRLVSLGSSYNYAESVAGSAIGAFDPVSATTTGGTFTFAGSNATGAAPAYGAGVSLINPLSGAVATDVVARVRQRIDTLSVTALGDSDGRTTFTVGGADNTEYFDEVILTPTWMYYTDPTTGQPVPYDQLFADNNAWLAAIPLREASDFLIASTSYVTSTGAASGMIVAANVPDVSVLAPGLTVGAVSGTLKTNSSWGGDPKTWGVTGTIGDDRFGFYGADSVDEVTFNYRTGQAEKISFQYGSDTRSATFETRNFYTNDSSVTATLPLPGGGTYTGPLTEALTAEAYRTVDGTIAIGAGAQTAQAAVGDLTVTYGDSLPGYDGTGVTGLNAADAKIQALLPGAIYHDVAVTAGALGAYPDVGTYSDALTLSYGAGSYFGARYATTVDPGSLTVTPRAITIDIGDATKVYGDANPGWIAGGAQNAVVNGAAASNFSITGGSIAAIDATGGKGIAIDANTAATAATGVGAYDIVNGGVTAVGGLKLSNYDVTVTNGTLDITKRAITIDIGDANRTYGDANPAWVAGGLQTAVENGAAATNFSITNGSLATVDIGASKGIAIDANTVATTTSSVGSYDITAGTVTAIGGVDLNNYDVTVTNGTLTIDKRALEITVGNDTRIYGDANPAWIASGQSAIADGAAQTHYSVTGGSFASFDQTDADIALNVSTAAGAASGVGSYAIAGSVSGSSDIDLSNYDVTVKSGTLQITPRDITVAIGSDTKVYGDANPAWIDGGVQPSGTAFGVSNLASADSGATLGLDVKTVATTNSSVGSYDITNNGGLTGVDLANYNVTYQNGTLSVTPADLTVTIGDKTRTYGDVPGAYSHSVQGFKAGDDEGDLGGTLVYAGDPGQNANAGFYGAVLTGSGLTSSNYNISYVAGDLTIDKALLTVTVADQTRTYGDVPKPYSDSITGFVLGQNQQTAAGFGGSLSVAGDPGQTAGAGFHDGVLDGAGSSYTATNYDFQYVAGDLTIDRRAITVAIGSDTKIYGDANPAWIDGGAQPTGSAFTVSNVASIDSGATLGLDVKTNATTGSNVGSYGITNNGALTGLDLSNYDVTYQDGTLQVTPANLVVTIGDKTRTYGDAPGPYTYGIDGYKAGDDEGDLGGNLVFAGDPGQSANAGFYDGVLTGSGLTSSNYTISYVNGDVTINKALLTVTVADQTRTYGGAPKPYSDTITGFVLGQTRQTAGIGGALVVTGDPGQTANAGFYNDTLSGSGSTYSAANYDFQYVAGDLTIAKAPLVVTVIGGTRGVGQPNPPFSHTIDGFVLGQGPGVLGGQIVYTTPANPQSQPGYYPVDGSGYSADNYAITYVPGTLQVVGAFYGNNGIADGFLDPYTIGRDPDTPGDAVYRTTRFENPFIQDAYVRAYSLGVVNTGVAGSTSATGLAALSPAAGPGAIATNAPDGFKTGGQFIDRGVVAVSGATPVAGAADAETLAALEPAAGPDAEGEAPACGIGATLTDYWACKITATP